MSVIQYPFIDVAVSDPIRTRFASGEGLVLFSSDMRAALWANGRGAALFGFASIYDFLDQGPNRNDVAFRQAEAVARQLLRPGDSRGLAVRVNSGFQRVVIQANCELVEILGQRAILIALASDRQPISEPAGAAAMIEGFDDADTHTAVVDEHGAILAASRHFNDLGVPQQTIRMLQQMADGDPGRLAKRPISLDRGHLPAAMAKLSDAPALYLLFAVDTFDDKPDATVAPFEPAVDTTAAADLQTEALDAIAKIEDGEEVQEEISLISTPADADEAGTAEPTETETETETETDGGPQRVTNGEAGLGALPPPAFDSEVEPDVLPQPTSNNEAGADAPQQQVSNSEAEPDARPQSVSNGEAKADASPQPVSNEKAEPDALPQAVSHQKAEPDALQQQVSNSEAGSDARPQPVSNGEAEADALPQPASDNEAEPDARPQAVSNHKAEPDALQQQVFMSEAEHHAGPQSASNGEAEADALLQSVSKNEADAATLISEADGADEPPDAASQAVSKASPAPGATITDARAVPVSAAVAAEQEQAQSAAEDAAQKPRFVFQRDGRATRFVWKIDATGHFTEISREFAGTVGPSAASVVGMAFSDVAALFHLDPEARIGELLNKRDTWSGKTIWWPVEGTSLVVPVDLAALPTYTRSRDFDGFRGFGIVRVADATEDPHAIGLDLSPRIAAPAEPKNPSKAADQPHASEQSFADASEAAIAAKDAEEKQSSAEQSNINGTATVDVVKPVADTAPEAAADDDRLEPSPLAASASEQNEPFLSTTEMASGLEWPEGERPALRLVDNPGRRNADRTIQLVNTPSRLTPGEQATFREIARQLDQFVGSGKSAEKSLGGPAQSKSEAATGAEPIATASEDDRDVSAKRDLEQAHGNVSPVLDAAETQAAASDLGKDDTIVDTSSVDKGQDTHFVTAGEDTPRDQDAKHGQGAKREHDAERGGDAVGIDNVTGIDGTADTEDAPAAENTTAAEGARAVEQATAGDEATESDKGTAAEDAAAAENAPAAEGTADGRYGTAAENPGPAEHAENATNAHAIADGHETIQAADAVEVDAVVDRQNTAEAESVGDARAVADVENTADVDDGEDGGEQDYDHDGTEAPDDHFPPMTAEDIAPVMAENLPMARNEDALPPAAEETHSAADTAATEANPVPDHALLATMIPLRERIGLSPEIVDQMPVALLVHSGDHLIHGNPEFLKLTGYETLDQLAEIGGLDALLQRQELNETSNATSGMVVVRANDEIVPVTARLQSVRWGDGSALMLALMPTMVETGPADQADRTAEIIPLRPMRPADQVFSLQVEVAELRAILETATDGVVIIDADGHIRSMNRAANALFNYDGEDINGKPFVMLFAHESQRAIVEYLSGLSGHGVASVLNDGREVIGREASGGFLPLFMTIGRLTSSNGYCAVIRDITQWKRTEDELRAAKRTAETANAHKSEFLAHVSHEIRTPLNAIIGFADMMETERFGPIGHPRYIEYANDIGRSGRHVLDIVNDLLDISKIEAGEMEMDFVSVGLNETVSEAVSLVQPQANGQRVIIRTALSHAVPPVVADLRSVKQIVLNILSNAIRFTPSGGQIVVSTAYETNGSVVLRIRDTGIGMTRSELELAMKPFRQVAGAARKRGDGTGLGLPLTKAMVDANRASFAISSAPNEGTLVEISFPSQRVLAS